MKTLLAISLAFAIGLSATAIAKQNDKNGGPKSKAPPPQKQQHNNPGPRVNSANLQKNVNKHESVSRTTKTLSPNTKVITDQKFRKNAKTVTISKAKIEKIRTQHLNFKANPNPKIPSVTFNPNYQIAEAQNWTGPQYQAFVSYRPQWHDQTWWRSSPYSANLLLIGGGWYYWDAGYWYPAWGYDESAAYYPYDGPIYVGDTPRPFDQVVADCQATLQEQGYYKGEVDGLMGPLTRQALAAFQAEHGLITTAALDQPTLASLGLG
jgi:hypothetical protein